MNKIEQIRQMLNESKLEQQQGFYGLLIHVKHIQSIQSRKKISTLSLQIQQKRIKEHVQSVISSTTTSHVQKKKGIWTEDIYSNNNINQDTYHFTLIIDQTNRSNTIEINAKQYFSCFNGQDIYNKTEQLQFRLGNDACVTICMEISVFENEDFIVGVKMPQLSLARLGDNPHIPQYNAIQVIRYSKLNCFSCMDEVVTGFDNLQLVCSRIQKKNKPTRQT